MVDTRQAGGEQHHAQQHIQEHQRTLREQQRGRANKEAQHQQDVGITLTDHFQILEPEQRHQQRHPRFRTVQATEAVKGERHRPHQQQAADNTPGQRHPLAVDQGTDRDHQRKQTTLPKRAFE